MKADMGDAGQNSEVVLLLLGGGGGGHTPDQSTRTETGMGYPCHPHFRPRRCQWGWQLAWGSTAAQRGPEDLNESPSQAM